MLGFTGEEILSVFKIIAVVLKLGNLNFIPITNIDGTEGCEITNDYGECGGAANGVRVKKIECEQEKKTFSKIQLHFSSPTERIFSSEIFSFSSSSSSFILSPDLWESSTTVRRVQHRHTAEIRDIAQLLEIDEQIILNCLTKTGSSWMVIENGSELDAINANLINKALCRTLFGRLFTFVVNRLNESLKVRVCRTVKWSERSLESDEE